MLHLHPKAIIQSIKR